MTASLPVSQNKRRTLYRNLMIAAIALLALCAIIGRLTDLPMHIPAAPIVAAIGVLSFLQLNALDEVAKQAHYVAWYWGGLLALSAMALLIVAFATSPAPLAFVETMMERWTGKTDTETAFLLGLITTPTFLAIGFFGWWVAYWLRHR